MNGAERDSMSDGFGQILEAFSAFQRAADDRYATKDALSDLSKKVDDLLITSEAARRNATGANNWSKITVAVIGVIPAVVGVAKAVGLL